MNTLYKISILGLIGCTCIFTNISSQTNVKKDTIFNRHVYLERDYTPTIRDASKINTLPEQSKPETKQYDIKFETTKPIIQFSSYPLGNTDPGNFMTQINHYKNRGYFNFGGGMYSNLEGTLGYRIVDGSHNRLDLFTSHNSTNGNIKYLEDKGLDKVKAKNMENFAKLRYAHVFDYAKWDIAASLFNNGYNYYGNPFVVSGSPQYILLENLGKKQTTGIYGIETNIESQNNGSLIYAGSLNYKNFSNKFGQDIALDGASANLIDAKLNIAFPFLISPSMSVAKLGIEGGALYQKSDNIKFIESETDPSTSFSSFKISPYLNIGENSNPVQLTLGANFNMAFDKEKKILISPIVKFNWEFASSSSFYINVDGGINNNDLASVFSENRYINPTRRIEFSRTAYDALLGIKSGSISGFEFDVFGGYKYIKNEHLYLQTSTQSWANISDVIYANFGIGHLGGIVKTSLIPRTDLSLKIITYFYNLKEFTNSTPVFTEKKAWGLPDLLLNLNACFSISDNLTFSANYIYEGGRKTYLDKSSIKMNNINELNISLRYEPLKWLSFYAKADNLMNQKYEKYYGYTSQGINLLGGIGLKF